MGTVGKEDAHARTYMRSYTFVSPLEWKLLPTGLSSLFHFVWCRVPARFLSLLCTYVDLVFMRWSRFGLTFSFFAHPHAISNACGLNFRVYCTTSYHARSIATLSHTRHYCQPSQKQRAVRFSLQVGLSKDFTRIGDFAQVQWCSPKLRSKRPRM